MKFRAEEASAEMRATLSCSRPLQGQAAIAYANALCLPESEFNRMNWSALNQMIMRVWPKGLRRVKRMAWKIADKWGRKP